MGIPRNETLAESIYRDIENNTYLCQIYSDLLHNYSIRLFSLGLVEKEIDLHAALRFADILSKSSYTENAPTHKMWAQEIMVLLHTLYPSDEKINTVLGSVLSSIGNYRGLNTALNDYKSVDILDRLYYAFDKERLIIPGKTDEFFFRTQKLVYDTLGKKCFSYSGPTSMGKSFVVQTYIKEQIKSGIKQNFAILVPTKALINEVRSNLCAELNVILEETNYRIVVSAGDIALKHKHNYIFVMTPERMLHLLNTENDISIGFMFVDEAHKISEKGPRSAFYYKVLNKVVERETSASIIFASPNIPNPEIYLKLIPGVKNMHVESISSKFAPVCQFKYLVNMTTGQIYSYNEHSKQLNEIHHSERSRNLADLVYTVGRAKQNIVYCSSKVKAIDSAVQYAQHLPNLDNFQLNALADDIANEVHSDCYLSQLIKKGVAYHVGYLPASIRHRIEQGFEEGVIRTIFCTSTLVEGVNLPADNLFITSYKNGNLEMDPVEFRNLVGRVGRIKYNLYGNVFLLIQPESTNNAQKKYLDLLNNDVPMQDISLTGQLKQQQRKEIIDYLVRGDIQITDCNGRNLEQYSAMRKFALIVAHDIVLNKNTPTVEAFSDVLTSEDKERIKEQFEKNRTSDDITFSYDQLETLEDAIINGLKYPQLNESGDVDFNELVEFLCRLRHIFKWNIYEKSSIGRQDVYGNFLPTIEWYATILIQWIRGNGLGHIIRSALAHKKCHPQKGVWSGRHRIAPYYDDSSIEHRNYVIAETLDVIENVILFSISNYFRKFSLEYKRIHNVEYFANDWYEFVEYGTFNPLTIFLQQNGYSRESSQYIMSHPRYIVEVDGEYKIKESILTCNNLNVIHETKDIIYNAPDLFIKE